MAALLECTGLHAGYGKQEVVRGFTMSVEAGEVVALLGPNGSGKTTTLLTLAGYLPPLGGALRYDGADIPAGRPHVLSRRGLALVHDDRALFATLTVRENLILGCRSKRTSEIDRMLEYFPLLEGRLNFKAGLLSGGEQQMLAMARALVSKPKVLLVDELSMGLAPTVVQSLLPTVRRVALDAGAGVVLVEQHVRQCLAVADRGIVLVHGRIALEGPARELIEHPDRIEASYLGAAESANGTVDS